MIIYRAQPFFWIFVDFKSSIVIGSMLQDSVLFGLVIELVNIGFGNGLVQSGKMPSPEPMVIYCQVTLRKKLH